MARYQLRTALDVLSFDADTGRLVSLTPRAAPQRELLAGSPHQPAFALQLLDHPQTHILLDSSEATRREVTLREADGGGTLTIACQGLGGLDLDVTLTVTAAPRDRFSRWVATVRNGSGLTILDLQFPFVVAPLTSEGKVLLPQVQGQLVTGPALAGLPEDQPRRWQFWPENGNSQHYPGRCFAQFLAWYEGNQGLYLACTDTAGNVKKLQALRRPEGLRLGLSHVGDWPVDGERTLEYETLLGSFRGDWYDAADLYRQWALRQSWATPLTERRDIPAWLLDSPPHITIRLQGYVDAGMAPPIAEFLPYEKCVPLLEGVAAAVQAPLVAVLMSWERGGPWVYPDCFPPVGGDESLTNFCREARARGWHVGSFCNGTRWVVKHLFNDYDGTGYFAAHNGQQGVCRQPDGTLWHENWDQNWRPSYITCLAQGQTRDLAQNFVRRLLGWGMESIQFFDQNCNASTFPCFAPDHGHPPLPGKWMARAMAEMLAGFREAAADAGETEVIHSTEWPTNEVCLPLFQQSDLRLSVPTSGDASFVPVYQYLYHECTLTHGMMSYGPEPHSLETRTAWECVWGEMAGAVLTGDGTLLNRETGNWAEWEPKVGDNAVALEMLRTTTALRRGPGRDFLVYGRMQRPAEVAGSAVLAWENGGRERRVPAVAHACWEAPDGRLGVVLANWTDEAQTVMIRDGRLGERVAVHVSARELSAETVELPAAEVTVTLPPLSAGLVCTLA